LSLWSCRPSTPSPEPVEENLELKEECSSNEIEGEDGLKEAEPEIDPVNDPLKTFGVNGPDEQWEEMIREIKVRTPWVPGEKDQREKVRKLLRILDAEPSEPSEEQAREAWEWLNDIANLIPNHEEFVASNFAHFFPAWHELLKDSPRKSARAVISWLKSGFKPRFNETADTKPEKLEVVKAMLAKVMPRKENPRYLSSKCPGPVAFDNHQSLYTNWGFSSDQIQKLVEYGAAGIWDKAEPPVVINPLGVVDSAGKQRMIVNGRVTNAFLRALPFRYEKLRDILAFTEQGSFMATWDLKSGYFHVPMHPAYQKYFAFKVGGITFYFKVLCFGFAQTCFVFTKVMQEPAFELRKRGIPLSDYIDDAFTAARTINRCARQSALSVLFFGALGAFLGLPKCHLFPEQIVGWLGFLVDSLGQKFLIGEKKIAKIKAVLLETIANPTTSPRKLAKLAGKLVSISPAVLPAALLSRSLFEAMQGKVSWDTIFPTAESVRDTAHFWLDNLDRLNGRRWWPRKVGLRVSVDASNLGYGGTFLFDSGQRHNSQGRSRIQRQPPPARNVRCEDMWQL
jgi:hypothetical protein